jgi:hypothetical protein
MSDHHTEERTQLHGFIKSLKGSKSAEGVLSLVRVVRGGLFVDERAVSSVAELYQSWLTRESGGAVQKPLEKCVQWLFEGREPPRHYLVEGKSTLVGHLIPVVVPTPQQFGIPYYLGSLLSAEAYLHPSDPAISRLKGVVSRTGPKGLEFVVSARRKEIVITEKAIKDFACLARSSRFMERRYPESLKTLVGAFVALVGLVRRSREVARAFPVVVPFDVKVSKGKSVRLAGKFMFLEDRGALTRVIELSGRNLSGFLREELERVPREKLGSFRLTPKHRDLMGFYEVGGKRRSVHARAFGEFEEAIRRTRDDKERFKGFFCAAECFEKFTLFYQLSRPIPARQIQGVLERFGIKGATFQLYGGWIFAFDGGGTIIRCVGKHIVRGG